VLNQLVTVSADRMANVRYGRDLLRLVDTNTLDYLAQTIGAVLYQSSALTDAEQQSSNRQLVETYFNRLRIKGTAESFSVLGRILGFDDVMVTPLFGRLSAHRPNDIGNPANDADFKAEPDYYPQQAIDAFYDPNVTNDGPFYSWSGTVSHGTASTDFTRRSSTASTRGSRPWCSTCCRAPSWTRSTGPTPWAAPARSARAARTRRLSSSHRARPSCSAPSRRARPSMASK
jgi:hypothetical protein